MPKQLINTVGILIVALILVAGTALVALPLWLQSRAVSDDAATAAMANDTLQLQVDGLAAQQAELGSIEDELEELQEGIPAAARIDTISAVVADAAAAAGVTLTSFTPADVVAYTGTGSSAGTAASEEPTADAAPAEAASGEMQIPIDIVVSGPDIDTILAFIDALREGPRLLGDIQAAVSTNPDGADATVTAYAFAVVPQEAR